MLIGFDKYIEGGTERAAEKAKAKLLYPKFLGYELSADDNWTTVMGSDPFVVADIVSYDSSTPLKRRPSLGVVSGKMPKRAIKRALNESNIMQYRNLKANGASKAQLAGFLVKDAPFCTMGIENSIEYDFLSLLSGEATLVLDETNDRADAAVRLQLNNKNVVTGQYSKTAWENAIKAANDKMGAEVAVMSQATFNKWKASDFAKLLHASSIGVEGGVEPTTLRFIEDIKTEYNIDIVIADTRLRVESNGVRTAVQPFVDDVTTFLPSMAIGRVAYTLTASHLADFQKSSVVYSNPTDYTLVSVESVTIDPIRVETIAQAIAMPVFDEMENIVFLELKS